MWRWEIETQSPLLFAATYGQATTLLDITLPALERLIENGEIPVIMPENSLIEVSALQDFLERNGLQQPDVVIYVRSSAVARSGLAHLSHVNRPMNVVLLKTLPE